MSPLTRRSLIATLGLGAGATAAGLLAPTAAFASSPSRSFSTLIFDEQFKDGSDFNAARWREKAPKGDTYLDYDWGVITHDTHSVSGGTGHLFWRKRSAPKTGWQNKHDKGKTVRHVNEASLTTEGLFSFVYGSVEVRARFPQQNLGLWAGVWLRPDGAANGGEIDIVETYGGGRAKGIAESTVHFDQSGKNKSGKGVSNKPNLSAWHTYRMEKTPERITFFFDNQRFHEVLRSRNPRAFDHCFGAKTPYHLLLITQTGSHYWGQLDTRNFKEAQFDIDYLQVRSMG